MSRSPAMILTQRFEQFLAPQQTFVNVVQPELSGIKTNTPPFQSTKCTCEDSLHTCCSVCVLVQEMDHRLRAFPMHDFPSMQPESAS